MNGKELIQELEKRDKKVPILIEIENRLYKINVLLHYEKHPIFVNFFHV